MSLECIYYSCFYCTFAGISDKPSSQRDSGVRGLSLYYASVGLREGYVPAKQKQVPICKSDRMSVKREK